MIKHVKPTRLSVCRGLAAAALGCLALAASAQTEIPYNGPQRNTIEYKQAGNSYTWTPVTGETPRPAQPYRPDLSGGSVSSVEPKYKWSPQLPYEHKGGSSAKTSVNWPIDPGKVSSKTAEIVAGAATGLFTGNGYVAAASVACAFLCQPAIEALTAWGVDKFKKNPDGSISVVAPDPAAVTEFSDGYTYVVSFNGEHIALTPSAACSSVPNVISSVYDPRWGGFCDIKYYYSGTAIGTAAPSVRRYGGSQCLIGQPVVNGVCHGEALKETPIGTYLESNYTGKGWDHHWAGITAGLVAAGVNVFTDGTGSTITGPAVVPVSTSETKTPVNLSPGTTTPAPPGHTGPTDSGTQTTTTTTTANNTYRPGSSGSGPSMETKTQTQTTTNITNNITNNTSSTVVTNTTETDKAPEEEEKDFCEKNPDSLACAEADTPEQETPTGQLNISYEYVDIFGNGSCPSDSYLNTHGQSLKVWDWAATCDNVQSYFRPILIACCAFAAFVIVSAGAKE